ncbi:MAG: hypothetical protein IKS41_01460 [Alphaproteobacteria bacterium]|nr:hypothetical protein [Alphaproteobacteria bacterium]
MATLTDADKQKTIAEYLGLTGTREEIQEQVERDSSKLQDFIREHAYNLYGVVDTSTYRDSKGLYFPYAIRALMYQDKKDDQNRLIADLSQLTPRTVGELVANQENIGRTLVEQAGQIKDDYEDGWGSKKNAFLDATEYSSIKDDYIENYFRRFWRSPISSLMKYRGIDTNTPEGNEHAKKIIRKLYGPETDGSDIATLLTKTPECLVEDKDAIEKDKRRKEADKENREEELKEKPLYETLKEIHGLVFPLGSDNNTMAAIAAGNEDAKDYIKRLLRLEKRDDPDLTFFQNTIGLSPNQIVAQADSLKKDLVARIDEKYITDHPEATFGEFLRERRPDLLSEDEKRVALEEIIHKNPGSVDNTAVKKAQDTKCAELRTKADKIVKDSIKRRRRGKITTLAVSAFTAAMLLWSAAKAFTGGAKETKPDKAPSEEKKPTPRVPEKQAAKAPAQKAPAPTIKAPTRDDTPAPATTSTNMVQKAIDTGTTNDTAVAQHPSKPTEVIGKKGNRLIAFRWTGFTDNSYTKEMKQAPVLLFNTYFDYMNSRIQATGLPFADLFKPEHTRRAIKSVHNYVWLKPIGSQEKIRFYIRDDGKTRDAIMEDVLSIHMNWQDTLQSLPVPVENLPMAQSKVMTALGPQMGLSVKQQMAWQRMHPQEAQDASLAIAETTRAAIQAHNVDTNNVEAVFMETVEAARIYRRSHPNNIALLLSVDEVTRNLANMERENMTQYNQLAVQDQAEVKKHIIGMHQDEEAERREEIERENGEHSNIDPSSVPDYPPAPSKSDDEGGIPTWVKLGLAGAGLYYLGKRRGKKDR